MSAIRILEGPFDGGKVYPNEVTREGSFVLWQKDVGGNPVAGFLYSVIDADRARYQYVEVLP